MGLLSKHFFDHACMQYYVVSKMQVVRGQKAIQVRQTSALEDTATQSSSYKNLTMQSRRIVSGDMASNKAIFKETKMRIRASFFTSPHIPTPFIVHTTSSTQVTWIRPKNIISECTALSTCSRRWSKIQLLHRRWCPRPHRSLRSPTSRKASFSLGLQML